MSHKKLVDAKSKLVKYSTYLDSSSYNYESIEYIISTLDHIITGNILCSADILSIILDDMLVCNTYEKSRMVTEAAIIVARVIKEQSECMK